MNEFIKFLNFNFLKKGTEMQLKSILPGLLTDLYYPSESDEPIEVFSLEENPELPLAEDAFRNLMQIEEDTLIEALDVERFWATVTEVKDWYEAEQVTTTEKFKQLKNTLFEHLEDVQGFRVGEIEIDVYVFGVNSAGEVEGIKTMLVET